MRHSFVVIALILFVGCSPTKFVPEGSYMLSGVEVKSHDKNFDPEGLEAYVRQRGNSRWFSSLKIPLGVYSLAGRDTTRWINRTLRRAGEAPILFDEDQAQRSKEDLERAMQNRGYLNAKAELHTEKKGKSLRAIYDLYPGQSYQIGKLDYEIEDTVFNITYSIYKKVTGNLSPQFTDVPPGFDIDSLPVKLSQDTIQLITPQPDAAAEEDMRDSENNLLNLAERFDDVLQWAAMYDKADMPAKKMIVSRIIERVDMFRDYEIKITLNISIEQFLNTIEMVA